MWLHHDAADAGRHNLSRSDRPLAALSRGDRLEQSDLRGVRIQASQDVGGYFFWESPARWARQSAMAC